MIWRNVTAHTRFSPSATRRNKWICALKTYLAEAKIYGPKGDPNAIAAPTRYTEIPWEEVKAKDKNATNLMAPVTIPEMPRGGYDLINRSVSKRKFSLGGERFEFSNLTIEPPRT